MSQYGRVGGVHVVRSENRRRIRGQRAESGQAAPTGLRFNAPFRGVEDARAVRDAGAGEGKCLDHAVAVEPVAVAVAEALVLGWTIAPQDTGKFPGQAPTQRGEGGGELRRAGGRESQKPRVPRQPGGKVFLASGAGSGCKEEGNSCYRAQRVTAGELRDDHREDSGHRIATTIRCSPSSGPMVTAAAAKLGGPMKPRASLEKP